MSWRHANRARSARAAATKATPYDGYAKITMLEANVIGTIPSSFELADTKRAFWDDDIVEKLEAAFPFVRDVGRCAFHNVIGLPLGLHNVRCNFSIDLPKVGMLYPDLDYTTVREEHAQGIIKTVSAVYQEHQQFNKVRDVLDWLNAADHKVTPGAARYLCPWLTSILPANHPVATVDGQKFNPPHRPHPAELMREAGAIIALAHMAPVVEPTARRDVTVSFVSHGDRPRPQSNVFGIC